MNPDFHLSLKSNFAFNDFRPGQLEAIQHLAGGSHTLVVMPTGSGKSLIYQLLSLHLDGTTLVISPLIALMKDQVDSLERRGIPATYINSSLPAGEQGRRLRALAQGKYRLVYVAPERLRSVQFREALKSIRIALLAVDEAHCISNWGHDSRPDYLHIADFRAELGAPLTVALTATATPRVQDDVIRRLGLGSARRILTGFNRPNLALEVRYISSPAERLRVVQELLRQAKSGAAIIYTGTRRDAEEVAEFASTVSARKARYYHAGLPADERTEIQDAFMGGGLSIVAATNAFGMGIDRQDVRLVLHFAMPGSLEAYYQEAGRAGRDGLPARAVMLYSPQDRALQEFFIKSSSIAVFDLRTLYDELKRMLGGRETVTFENLSRQTGLMDVRLRVCLSALEQAGAVERLGDDGYHLLLKAGAWQEPAIQAAVAEQDIHLRHRSEQLQKMVDYAESNHCRRKILLDHFGDTGSADAPVCCDNCLQRQAQKPLPPKEKAPDQSPPSGSGHEALVILDLVRRLRPAVGVSKICKILKGSRAKDITDFGYDKNIYYCRLLAYSREQLEQMVRELIHGGYLKSIGGEYPVVKLTPLGESTLSARTHIEFSFLEQISPEMTSMKKAERDAGGTVEYTIQLFNDGLDPLEIATKRDLNPSTIYGHLSSQIASGKINISNVIAGDIQSKIEEAIQKCDRPEILRAIKELLPEEISFGEIRCVVEWYKLHKDDPQITQSSNDDPVEKFLSGSHPRPLKGPWSAGWALGFHSGYSGADWNRSPVGELAYRLKYQSDLTAIPELVELAGRLVAAHPEYGQLQALIPVPCSIPHPNDPLASFARALAQKLELPYLEALKKTRQTAQQKELHTLAQKHANVLGAFALSAPVKGRRLLVVDDLYDSGATLEEITRLLQKSGASAVCVLTLTRTIHSDA